MKSFQIKNIDGGTLDVSSTSRRVKIAISQVGGTKDLDGDVIDPKAYNRTISERGPKAANLIWHLTDHYASLKSAVGKFTELFVEGDKLVGVTDIPKTTWGNDVLEFYKSGAINQHSIGYKTVSDEKINPGKPEEYNLIKEVLLYEGSAVLWAANPNTPTLTVGKNLGGTIECPKCHKYTKDIEAGMGYWKCTNCNEVFTQSDLLNDEFKKTMDEFGKMNLMFKKGSLSDEAYELIEIKISQLSEKLQQLFIHLSADKAIGENQPADNAFDSVNKGSLDVLTTFNNNLKRNLHGQRTASATG